MIKIKETSWHLEIDLIENILDLQQKNDSHITPEYLKILDKGDIMQWIVHQDLWKKLTKLGDYKVKVFSHEGFEEKNYSNNRKEISKIKNITKNFCQHGWNNEGMPTIKIPKGKITQMEKLLERENYKYTIEKKVYPNPNFLKTLKPLTHPKKPEETITLEYPQRKGLQKILSGNRSGIVDYAMGGGKTTLIANILRAFPEQRPAIITSRGASDTEQLAGNIAKMLDEKIHICGCNGGNFPKGERKRLFVPSKKADIIIGTHSMVTKARRFKEKQIEGLDQIIANAQLFIADEVHELCSELRINGLTAMDPKIAFGFTGTWLKRLDKVDHVLGDLFNLGGFKDVLCKVKHKEVQESGRVVETEIHTYKFPKESYPETNPNGFKGFDELQALTVYHSGKNKFISELCRHLMNTNRKEKRGCILAFTPTIKHAQIVCLSLAKDLNISPTERELEENGIALYNAAMPDTQKLQIRQKIEKGEILLTLTTDTLSTGIDIPRVYDCVDISGQLKTNVTLQRSGRTVRVFEKGKIGRMHIIFDDQSGLLRGISTKKQKLLEEYYQTKSIFHTVSPWKDPQPIKKETFLKISK